jgi:hypothetical protein
MNQKPSLLRKHRNLFIMLAIIVALPAVYVGYNSYQDYSDKKRFEILSESLQALRDMLQVESGDGMSWNYSEGCRGPIEHKSSILPPSCTMTLSSSTPFVSIDDSQRAIKKYDQIIIDDKSLFMTIGDSNLRTLEETAGSKLRNDANKRSFKTERGIEESTTSITCKVEYRVDTDEETRFYIGCGNNARKEWF